MRYVLALGALALITGTVACGDNSTNEPGETNNATTGKSDDNTATYLGATLPAAIAACETYRTTELEKPENESTAGMIQVTGTYTECLKEANNTTIEHIQALNEEVAFGTEVDIVTTFAQYRAFQDSFCNIVVPGGQLGEGSMGRVILSSCFGEAEAHLSELILTYVELQTGEEEYLQPANPATLDAYRPNHEACFVAMDTAMETAASQAEMSTALWELGNCIQAESDSQIGTLAQGLVDNGFEEDVDKAKDGIAAVFAGNVEWAGSMCYALASASSERGGTITQLYGSDCIAIDAAWRAKYVNDNLTGY